MGRAGSGGGWGGALPVGTLVEVFWPGERDWFGGQVGEGGSEEGVTVIEYFDGDPEREGVFMEREGQELLGAEEEVGHLLERGASIVEPLDALGTVYMCWDVVWVPQVRAGCHSLGVCLGATAGCRGTEVQKTKGTDTALACEGLQLGLGRLECFPPEGGALFCAQHEEGCNNFCPGGHWVLC
ncbi:hypothetical protein CYMTET_56826 [Cymbomonas tetramitiformis]|uniref:Tudor domain-containing protein n=1 Tax=Cymbomonas tetramitiformis TaxID=36881 RepID=A0AAE0BBN1_9CHLO|nr:hypothetical protein CYMTET_56826 [Cymbomonas tetramitiformis]